MTPLDAWLEGLPDVAEERLPKALKLVIPGPPRTKKNSPVIVRNIADSFLRELVWAWETEKAPRPAHTEGEVREWITNREIQLPYPRLLPSQAYRDWKEAAVKAVLPLLEPLRRFFPITYACHLMARVYRDRDAGDWCGYMQGIGDFLEDVGVLEADVLIRSFDGSRLHKDVINPRIELWLSPWTQEGDTGLFERPAREWVENEEPEPDFVSIDQEADDDGSRSLLYTVYRRAK